MSGATTMPVGPELAVAVAGPWWERLVLGNPVWAWGVAALTAVLVYAGFVVVRRTLRARLRAFAGRTETRLDDLALAVLGDVRAWCILALAVYAGGSALALPGAAARGLKLVLVVAVALQLLVTSRLVVDYAIRLALARHGGSGGAADDENARTLASASGIIRFVAMLVLAALLLLLALANMGVQITPLVTGLGIGGIAVALAAQSILGDLFGSLSIVFDKPFLVGDYIVVGDKQGTVENIGVKTTRLRALSGEQLVIANSDLLSSRIQNFKRMQQRRVQARLTVVYETEAAKIARAAGIIRECLEGKGGERVRVERSHLAALGDSGIVFEYVYFVLSADNLLHMDIQQAINLEILRRFEAEGLELAYPTSVQLQRVLPEVGGEGGDGGG